MVQTILGVVILVIVWSVALLTIVEKYEESKDKWKT